MKMKFPEGVTHFNRADGSVLLRDDTGEVEATSESMRLELANAGFQEVAVEVAVEEVVAASDEQTGDAQTGDAQ